ncbi:MAG: ABC transporter permease subunit [Actinobacteria bacterium]|uniref:Unannotated protein n=2 Tax=freshwater metagenome TaxID=449393 RepID=A0A6J7TI84_9ZZZZ|nr:ABC transporter permease subunit [Actinomycetota bacterium]MTA67747.1 ABC transporter permease subunit [Actinomycetota bacterium]MTB16053.1 ABC transporter permease subunit [Actinomycetota bacterium]
MRILFLKTWRDHWKSYLAWTLTLTFLIVIQMSIFPSVSKNKSTMQSFLDTFPDTIRKIFRMQDYTSGPGFLSTELYSMMIPLLIIAVGATWGAGATAEEEDEGTADLLFTLPISRTRILISKILATVSAISILGFLAMALILILRGRVDMEIASDKLLAATFSSISLGIFFTGISFVVGAFSRRKGAAVGVVTGIALVTFLIYSLSALVENFDSITPYNPMQWGLGSLPLFNGFDVPGILKLLAGGVVLLVMAVVVFDRKDINTP